MRRLPRFEFIHTALAGRPRLLTGVVTLLAVAVFLTAGWAAWFSYDLTAGLPDRTALRAIGDMAQSTTILDASDRPVFTIFKEQRIDVRPAGPAHAPTRPGRFGPGPVRKPGQIP